MLITYEQWVLELWYFTWVFLLVPLFFTLSPWPWSLTHFLENFNLANNFWTVSARALIFHMSIPCYKTLPWVPLFFTLWPWPWSLTHLLKTTLAYYFWTVSARALIFHMSIPCGKTFLRFHYFLPCDLDLRVWHLLFKNFNVAKNFWIVSASALMFHMNIPCDEIFL